MTPQRGFSLIESLITVALSGILVATSVSGLGWLAATNRQVSEINQFVTHLQLARGEAVKRHRRVVLCASGTGSDCQNSTQWGTGYLVFVDQDGDRDRSPVEDILRYQPVGSGVQIHASASRRSISYQPDGQASGTNLTVTFCDAGNRIPPKAVMVANSGRPRIASRHADGSPLSCS